MSRPVGRSAHRISVNVDAIAQVLTRHQASYRWLGVFASDVEELHAGSGHRFILQTDGTYITQAGGQALRMALVTSTNVARFELAAAADQVGTGAAGGGVIGAALGAAIAGDGRRGDIPAGMILGMLVGELPVGVATAPANQILTLRFDPDEGRWNVYHGPYVGWAKEALHNAELVELARSDAER